MELTRSRPPSCNPVTAIGFEGGKGLRIKYPSVIRKYPGESSTSSGGECIGGGDGSLSPAVAAPPAKKPRNVLGGPVIKSRADLIRRAVTPPPASMSVFQSDNDSGKTPLQ